MHVTRNAHKMKCIRHPSNTNFKLIGHQAKMILKPWYCILHYIVMQSVIVVFRGHEQGMHFLKYITVPSSCDLTCYYYRYFLLFLLISNFNPGIQVVNLIRWILRFFYWTIIRNYLISQIIYDILYTRIITSARKKWIIWCMN